MKSVENKISDLITKAYIEYRQKILDSFMNAENLNVVIIMRPKTFVQLKDEEIIYNYDNMYFVYLCGRKTPIMIEKDLPNETEFIIQSQAEYERKEQNKLWERMNKMFNVW